MSQSSANTGGGGPDFGISGEILAVIPTDPYEQLDLARKITSMAIASRVSKLEAEVGRIRQRLHEKDRLVVELEDKATRLEKVCLEADSRLKTVLDDNMTLSKERDSLTMTVKKLSRDLAKLEAFKRQLMESLNDDNSSQAETIDIGTCDQSVPSTFSDKDERTNGYSSQHSYSISSDVSSTNDEGLRSVQRFSMTPYNITPRLTPTGTPKIISTAVSPRKTSGTISPSTSLTWYPSSQQSSAASSPPRHSSVSAQTPRADGKEFFRQARSRLSYEQFSAFLANIKELNTQKQSREETLRKAEEIFGTENKDLYLSFNGLINRNMR